MMAARSQFDHQHRMFERAHPALEHVSRVNPPKTNLKT